MASGTGAGDPPAAHRGRHGDRNRRDRTSVYAQSIGTNLSRALLPALMAAALAALALLATLAVDRWNGRDGGDDSSVSTRAGAPLAFGIYPGGGVGTVGPQPATKPEDPARQMAALEALRGTAGRRFVVRLYTPYDGTRRSLPESLLDAVSRYSRAGFEVELVLTYRRRSVRPQVAARGYAGFVRRAVRAVRRNRRVVSVQITNEANIRGAPRASDGAYPGAREALIRGVIAAKGELRRAGAGHVRVGFNWAHERGRAARRFWRNLGTAGGRSFARAVDWVGINIYPGTWGPELPGAVTAGAVRARMIGALRTLRQSHLPRAKLGDTVALHVAETGYPTGAGRSEATQVVVADAAVRAVHDVRVAYHVTDFRWFDLRDADSGDPSLEGRYGLLRDDYAPKPAFDAFAALVARYGAVRSDG